MARIPRIKLPGNHACCYHVVTRVNAQDFRLNDTLKQEFINHLAKLKSLYYVSIAAYTVLDNHYHLLLRFDDPADIDPEQAIARWNEYHDGTLFRRNAADQRQREYVVNELTDLSSFMKRLNHHISVRHNRSKETSGTLWESRFKSTIVERGYSLVMCAAYIELNAFRASIVRKPEEYRYSSIHSLKQGNKDGLVEQTLLAEGLHMDPDDCDVKEVLRTYTALVYAAGTRPHKGKENGLVITEAMQRELEARQIKIEEGSLSRRIGAYILGKAVGQSEYVRRFYEDHLGAGYKGETRRRHAGRWLRELGMGLWTACARGGKKRKPTSAGTDTG